MTSLVWLQEVGKSGGQEARFNSPTAVLEPPRISVQEGSGEEMQQPCSSASVGGSGERVCFATEPSKSGHAGQCHARPVWCWSGLESVRMSIPSESFAGPFGILALGMLMWSCRKGPLPAGGRQYPTRGWWQHSLRIPPTLARKRLALRPPNAHPIHNTASS